MTTITEKSSGTPHLTNVRQGKLDWTVFAHLCVCVIPAMVPLDFGMPLLGAQYLAGSLFLFLGYHFIKRDRYRYMSLLVGAGPALSLMRGVFFYDSIFVFLFVGIALWAYCALKEVRFVMRDPIWAPLAFLCVLYWILSVVLKGNFGANLRALEFIFATAGLCLLANRRSYLATGLIGIGISATAYAIAMLPYGVRLGEGELDNGQTIGNPVLLGVPAALVVLLALTDRGRFLLLESKATARLILCMVVGQWLILSGSRGSWLVTITCLLIVLAYGKTSRKTILIAIAIGCVATAFVLSTDQGAHITTVFTKTVDSNRSLANRTSGRSSMWEALPRVFAASPVWGWGPGSAADADFMYTHRHLLFHSLYEQIIAECGLLGFIPMVIILFATLRRAIGHYRRYGELVPLVGIVGFMLIGVSVTAFDFVSGVYLGLALCSREPHPRFVAQQMLVTPMTQEDALSARLVSSY
jgi:O-antigen ligase